MKASPLHPDGVPGLWKMEFLVFLGTTFNLKTLVESGTNEGSTPVGVFKYFDQVHTIEILPELYHKAKARFQLHRATNVTSYLGSSRDLIQKVLDYIPRRKTLFYCDAHNSGPHTGDDGNVLPVELEAILAWRPDSIIAIDDCHEAFDLSQLKVKTKGWVSEYWTGMGLIYRPELYTIPPFEQGEWKEGVIEIW